MNVHGNICEPAAKKGVSKRVTIKRGQKVKSKQFVEVGEEICTKV